MWRLAVTTELEAQGDNNRTTDDDALWDLWHKAREGTRSYPDVIPALIREVIRLREELRQERLWNATRDAGHSS